MELMENKKIKTYLDLVCSKIKFKDIHGNIKEEILDHIENIVLENLEKGLSLEESIDIGIKQIGDPYILGEGLNKVHKPKPEWSILALTSIFIIIGIVSIYTMILYGVETEWRMIKNSIKMFLFGIAIVVGLYYFDYRKIKIFSKYIYIGTSILLVMGKGESIINFGFFRRIHGVVRIFTTDITYITPFLYAIALSGIFSEGRWRKEKLLSNLVILFLPIILILGFQSSRTTPIIMYFTMVLTLILISGGNIKYILGSIGCGITIVLIQILNNPYQIERLKNLVNPLRDPLGSGYMNVQLRSLISSAGFLGNRMNLVDTTQIPIIKMSEMHTDYIFSYIVYAFGWLAGIILIGLTIIFFIRLIKTIKTIEDNYGKLLVATFSSLFIIQFLYNILMILGLTPIASISMPFISYGTILNTINMIMIGIISSIYRRKDLVTQ